MRDGAELARALTQGWIDARSVPELEQPDVRDDVERRLRLVGHVLERAGGAWLARPSARLEEVDGLQLRAQLRELDLAVLCACYLHLVFLPAEHMQQASRDSREGVPVGEIVDCFLVKETGKVDVDAAVRRVCQAGWARRADGRLYPEPPLLALDERALHDPLAVRLLRQRIDRLKPRRSHDSPSGAR